MKITDPVRVSVTQKLTQHFGPAELPLAFFYTDKPVNATIADNHGKWNCIIAELARVRKGESMAWNADSLTCGGSRRYLGYTNTMRHNFEYFLSCGIPGEMEGERYIRTPEMVREMMGNMKQVPAGDRYIVFRRWDKLEDGEEPAAVIFFATADILSGLFTLANFDQPDGSGVIAPFGSGCSSIVYHPWFEGEKENPKAVIGMFDPSARKYVPAGLLTFAIPAAKFEKMVSYMDESFLTTGSWEKVHERIKRS